MFQSHHNFNHTSVECLFFYDFFIKLPNTGFDNNCNNYGIHVLVMGVNEHGLQENIHMHMLASVCAFCKRN
jgi:hypothetical protein